MDKVTPKHQWFDGSFYYNFISPFSEILFSKIIKLIPIGSKVVDFGCGAGYLGIKHHDHFSHFVGIDLSTKNIDFANNKKRKLNITNVDFLFGDATQVLDIPNDFDFAITSYVVHEMPEESRLPYISNMIKHSNQQIIMDYAKPIKRNLAGLGVYAIEFVAGSEHFSNFRNYQANTDIKDLIEKSNGKIRKIFNFMDSSMTVWYSERK
jgi:SAM-dependent methyltransferase